MLTSLQPRAAQQKNYQTTCKTCFQYFSSTSNKTRDRFKICGQLHTCAAFLKIIQEISYKASPLTEAPTSNPTTKNTPYKILVLFFINGSPNPDPEDQLSPALWSHQSYVHADHPQ